MGWGAYGLRTLYLLAIASVAIDGSKFKAVNNRDKNFTRAKVERRRTQLEESVARYLSQLDTADRQEPSEALAAKTTRLKEKLAKLKEEMERLKGLEARMLAAPDHQISLTDPDSRSMATSGRGSGVVDMLEGGHSYESVLLMTAHRDRDDAPAAADFQVDRIDPNIGPVAFEWSCQEGFHLAVDLLAEPADLALRDAAHAHGAAGIPYVVTGMTNLFGTAEAEAARQRYAGVLSFSGGGRPSMAQCSHAPAARRPCAGPAAPGTQQRRLCEMPPRIQQDRNPTSDRTVLQISP